MDRRITIWIILILAVAGLNRCIEPFEPDIERYDNLLVVDATITDLEEQYVVYLRRSFPYNDNEWLPERDATVAVEDEDGNRYSFYQGRYKRGRYYSGTGQFVGEAGKKYRIHITTKEGKEFRSDWEYMKPSPGISDLYYEYEEYLDDNNEKVQGIRIYLDTEDTDNETRYYRFEWEETWEYTTPLLHPNNAAIEFCYRDDSSGLLQLARTDNLTSDRLNKHEVVFVSNSTNRLGRTYSINVKQYALHLDAYEFFDHVINVNQNMGTLFDPIPVSVRGNISCITDPNEPVLGYFTASGVSEKRLMVHREDLPKSLYVPSGYEFCETIYVQEPEEWTNYIEEGWIYYAQYYDRGILTTMMVNATSCYDCTTLGYTKKPDYWE